MSPQTQRKQTNEKAAKAVKANVIRGSCLQSRIMLDLEKLRKAGWMIKQQERESSSGVKIYFRYTHPGGKTLKSAKDVEQQLRDDGVSETFQTTQTNVNAKQLQGQKSATHPSRDDHDDSDYEPPLVVIVALMVPRPIRLQEIIT